MRRFRILAVHAGMITACLPASRADAQSAEVAPSQAYPDRVRVVIDPSVTCNPYSGRVWLILTQRNSGEPRKMVNWGSKGPIYAADVTAWEVGTTREISPTVFYGETARDLTAGTWRAQAVIDLNRTTHDVINGPGNGYSVPVSFEWPPAAAPSGEAIPLLRIDQKVAEWTLKDSENRKLVTLQSALLSDFFGEDWNMRAAVMPPKDFDAADKTKRYPTVYVIGGMGTNIRTRYWMFKRDVLASLGMNAFVVYLDADCPNGHHAFADSANNGPVGTALVKELIPHLESKFPMIPAPGARYVTGHSSGGWSSLWLQISYPQVFGGCWSTSPDPVDFTAFQTVNIYAPRANMFVDEAGSERPISRPTPRGQLMTRSFCALEEVLGRGGQLQSFEAVFSPRGAEGKPQRLWDRRTGAIDAQVAQAWKKYDIHLLLKTNWKQRAPELQGKIHLVCGDQDTFYLDGAFQKLADFLKEVESDAQVEIVPGAGHTLPPQVLYRGLQQMAEKFKQFADGADG